MKNPGKMFEEDFKNSCENLLFVRFVDSNKYDFGKTSRFTPKNPCDCFVYDYPHMFFFELKSTKGTSFSFTPGEPWEDESGKDIKGSQVKALMEFKKNEGVFAGFILNLRDRTTKTKHRDNKTYFLSINNFLKLAMREGKKSINESEILKYGIEIVGNKKRTRYTYEVESLLNDLRDCEV